MSEQNKQTYQDYLDDDEVAVSWLCANETHLELAKRAVRLARGDYQGEEWQEFRNACHAAAENAEPTKGIARKSCTIRDTVYALCKMGYRREVEQTCMEFANQFGSEGG